MNRDQEAQPESRQGDTTPTKKAPAASLRRELMAIAVLYLVLSVLPFLIGLTFAP